MTLETPERSAEDILAGRLRITLAGTPYVLRVLTIGENEDWMASLDATVSPLIAEVEDPFEAARYLEQFNDELLPFVYGYDKDGVLPPIETIRRDVYPHEAIKAVMEVRLAANPTLGLKLVGARVTSPEGSAPTSLRQRLMDGLSRRFVH